MKFTICSMAKIIDFQFYRKFGLILPFLEPKTASTSEQKRLRSVRVRKVQAAVYASSCVKTDS